MFHIMHYTLFMYLYMQNLLLINHNTRYFSQCYCSQCSVTDVKVVTSYINDNISWLWNSFGIKISDVNYLKLETFKILNGCTYSVIKGLHKWGFRIFLMNIYTYTYVAHACHSMHMLMAIYIRTLMTCYHINKL